MMLNSENSSRIAVYAGTFDPITIGHTDIIERALRVFDRLIVAVARSTEKNTLFTAEEREELVCGAIPHLRDRVVVECFGGLLVDYVRSKGAAIVVRGLRAVSDYEYEAQVAIMNRNLCEDIETVYLMTSAYCSFISSSVVKQVAKNGGDVSGFVPKNVAERLGQVFGYTF